MGFVSGPEQTLNQINRSICSMFTCICWVSPAWPGLAQERKTERNHGKYSRLLAKLGVIKARSHSEWLSRGLSNGTPDLNRLACSGIKRKGGAEHAIDHIKPHAGMSHVCACWQKACVGFLGCYRFLACGASQLSAQAF